MVKVGFGDLSFWTDYNTFRTLTSGLLAPSLCVRKSKNNIKNKMRSGRF